MLADLEFECCYDRRGNTECPLDHSNSITSYIYTANNVATLRQLVSVIVAISYYRHHKDTHICNITGGYLQCSENNRLTSVALTLTLSLTAPRIPDLIIILPLNSA